ncbi:MAG: hypothetical protein JJ966_03880 [Balneolaceae bacterium]|nr:hypothetical protein [Balneolaceae bacterium]
MKTSLHLILFVLLSAPTFAQPSLSVESQIYPAGSIHSLRLDLPILASVNAFARTGLNVTDRRDWGDQDREEGQGYGFGAGVEFSNSNYDRISLLIRTDLWFLDINWTNFDTVCPIVPPCFENRFDGATKVTVLQPTIGFAYQIPLTGSFFLKPSVNLGYEINIKTEGEPVGEGAILLGGLQVGFRF